MKEKNVNEELLQRTKLLAKEMEKRIEDGTVLIDYTCNNNERIVITQTKIGTYGYQVFDQYSTKPIYYAESEILFTDLEKNTDLKGNILRYQGAKSRIQRNLTGFYLERVKDMGFDSFYISFKEPVDSKVKIEQRMAGYNDQDNITIFSADFIYNHINMVSDAQSLNKDGNLCIRIGLTEILPDGSLDYNSVLEATKTEQEVLYGGYGMSEEEQMNIFIEATKNAQEYFYSAYQAVGLPIRSDVKPNNLFSNSSILNLPEQIVNEKKI